MLNIFALDPLSTI